MESKDNGKRLVSRVPLFGKNRSVAAGEASMRREQEALAERREQFEQERRPNALGNAIRDARVEKNWTQAELAEKLGVKQQTVANWENGRRIPDLDSIRTLCEQFNVSFDGFTRAKGETHEEKMERLQTGAMDSFSDVGIVDVPTAMLWSAEFAKRRFGEFNDYEVQVAAEMLTFALIIGIVFDPAIEWWRDGISNIVDIYSGSVSDDCMVFDALKSGTPRIDAGMIIGKGEKHILEDDVGANDVERLVHVALDSFNRCSDEAKRFVGRMLPVMLMAQASETLALSDSYRRTPSIRGQLIVDMNGGYLSLVPADCLHRYIQRSLEPSQNDENGERTREEKATRLEIPIGARNHVTALIDGPNPVRKGYTFAGWSTAGKDGECVFTPRGGDDFEFHENYDEQILAPLMKLMHGRCVYLYAIWKAKNA